MKKILNQYRLGDMTLVYLLDTDTKICGMCIVPADMPFDLEHDSTRRIRVINLVQAKFLGDDYPGQYFGGRSLRDSQTTAKLKFVDQSEEKSEVGTINIYTILKMEEFSTPAFSYLDFIQNPEIYSGFYAVHKVSYHEGDDFVTVSTELLNHTDRDVKCEMVSAFSLCNISPYQDGAGEETLTLHRLRSRWSMEARLVSERFEDLLLEDCWCYGNENDIRFGQVGSMPVKGYFPFMAVEDTQNQVIWGVQMGCPSSWQMEVSRGDDGVILCGGIADREFGHWMKTIRKGETFNPISAVLSVCKGDIDRIASRLVSAQEKNLDVPASEEALPIIFNEYCTTWGDPSHKNILEILNAIKGKGVDYFVIDCGWYREDGIPWHISMGEYLPSKTLFPEGIDATVKAIHDSGMKAGIWFEFENIGPKCRKFQETEHMLKRDGIPLTTVNRRFWDMNDPWVESYLTERVIDFMNRNGFQYIKVDYNETIGIGCDHADSLGEGLRQNMEGTVRFFQKIKEKVPDVIIENCSSGGNRLEPVFMGLSSMASFSDAHECVEIPIIAANLHRAILPRQSQIWSVIRKKDDTKRIAYSINAGMLGRLCLSGDVTDLDNAQWKTIEEGISFYKKAAPFIKHGISVIDRHTTGSDRHPKGYQAVVRRNDTGSLVTIHTFGGEIPDAICVDILGSTELIASYSHNTPNVEIASGRLLLKNPENWAGYSFVVR